jgi:hypothetical protein
LDVYKKTKRKAQNKRRKCEKAWELNEIPEHRSTSYPSAVSHKLAQLVRLASKNAQA